VRDLCCLFPCTPGTERTGVLRDRTDSSGVLFQDCFGCHATEEAQIDAIHRDRTAVPPELVIGAVLVPNQAGRLSSLRDLFESREWATLTFINRCNADKNPMVSLDGIAE
jgi:hypothetical protein